MQNEGYGSPMKPVPPSEMDAVLEKRSSWPTVIGVISIALGSLGAVMYGCCGTLGSVMGPMMINMAPADQIDAPTRAQMDVMRQFMVANVALGFLATVLAIVLLISGIGLVRRRAWSRKSHIGWAIGRLILAIPHNVISYLMNTTMFEAMQKAAADSGDPMPPGLATIMGSIGAIGVLIGLVWAALWPTFVLIWFSRERIRQEVAQWVAESRASI